MTIWMSIVECNNVHSDISVYPGLEDTTENANDPLQKYKEIKKKIPLILLIFILNPQNKCNQISRDRNLLLKIVCVHARTCVFMLPFLFFFSVYFMLVYLAFAFFFS